MLIIIRIIYLTKSLWDYQEAPNEWHFFSTQNLLKNPYSAGKIDGWCLHNQGVAPLKLTLIYLNLLQRWRPYRTITPTSNLVLLRFGPLRFSAKVWITSIAPEEQHLYNNNSQSYIKLRRSDTLLHRIVAQEKHSKSTTPLVLILACNLCYNGFPSLGLIAFFPNGTV